MEEVCTILPPFPCRTICPPTACATRNIPSIFTDMILRHSSSEYSSNGAKKASRSADLLAALLCRTVISPNASTARSTIARTDSGEETSQAMPRVCTPYFPASSAASCSAASCCTSTTATSAPASASPAQKCCPRIPAPPVTTAFLPLRLNNDLYEISLMYIFPPCKQQFHNIEIEFGVDVDRAIFRHFEQQRILVEHACAIHQSIASPYIDRSIHIEAPGRVLTAHYRLLRAFRQ